MKIIKFTSSKLKNNDTINTSKIHKNQKSPTSKSPKLISQFKKSGSLDLTYYRQRKNDELQKIYRFNSCQKKLRAKSTSSTKSTSDFKQYIKNTHYKIQNPKKQLFYPQKKIFLKTQKKQRHYFYDLKASLQLLCQKLQKCIQTKSQKLFMQQYTEALKLTEIFDSKQNNDNLLKTFITFFRKCQQKRNNKNIQILNQKINLIQKDKLNLNIQMRKTKIKQQTLNLQINKLKDKNLELIKQLKKLKQKKYQNQLVQTSLEQFNQMSNNLMNNNNNMNIEFTKLIQQLRILKQKQHNMNILIQQLQKQGINLQKVYKRAIKQAKTKNNQKQCENGSQYSSDLHPSYQQQTKPTKKSSHHKNISYVENNNQSFADDSIIDQIQALSFVYDPKQPPIQLFQPKQVYICQKEMDQQLKQKLKLDFACLYQQQYVSAEQHEYSSQGFQTI